MAYTIAPVSVPCEWSTGGSSKRVALSLETRLPVKRTKRPALSPYSFNDHPLHGRGSCDQRWSKSHPADAGFTTMHIIIIIISSSSSSSSMTAQSSEFRLDNTHQLSRAAFIVFCTFCATSRPIEDVCSVYPHHNVSIIIISSLRNCLVVHLLNDAL